MYEDYWKCNLREVVKRVSHDRKNIVTIKGARARAIALANLRRGGDRRVESTSLLGRNGGSLWVATVTR